MKEDAAAALVVAAMAKSSSRGVDDVMVIEVIIWNWEVET